MQQLFDHLRCRYANGLHLLYAYLKKIPIVTWQVFRLKSWDVWQTIVYKRIEHFLSVESVKDINHIYFVIKDDCDEVILNSKSSAAKSKISSPDPENKMGQAESLEEVETLPKASSPRNLPGFNDIKSRERRKHHLHTYVTSNHRNKPAIKK